MEGRRNAPLSEAGGHLLLVKVGGVLVLTVLVTLLHASVAWAETFTVTNTRDSGAGSLRAAIIKANSRAGADQIVFADGAGGTITLASALPTVTDSAGLTIEGGGDVTVSGNETSNVHGVRVLAVGEGAKLSLRNLTVSDGEADLGGGIFNGGGTLTVSGSTFLSNESNAYGGGIYNDEGGTAEVSGSTFSGNWATDFGGGIFNDNGAKLTVNDSTFSANETADIGAGIANFGSMVVTGSTFSGNRADFGAGGIYNESGTLQVTNSTFSGNRDMTAGGGIWNSIGGTLEVVHSTFSGNISSEGAGGIAGGGRATLRGTIVANSVFGGNCFGVTDGGYNVSDDGTCNLTQATNSLPNTDPLLDPDGLQDNGGPTETIALQPESPAVDLVGQEACPPPATDQRGVARPQGEACDSGAFELRQKPSQPPECTIKGTPGDDFLKGTSANDRICGRGGNDIVVDYRGGNDTLLGHGGKDVLLDVKGKGLLKAGDGNDVLFALDDAPLDTMNGQSGSNDSCLGDEGDVRKNCERGSLLGLNGEERERLGEAKDAAGL